MKVNILQCVLIIVFLHIYFYYYYLLQHKFLLMSSICFECKGVIFSDRTFEIFPVEWL